MRLIAVGLVALAQTMALPWAFTPDSTVPVVVPSDVREAAGELEYDSAQMMKGFAVDINADGAAEYILQSAPSLCGANCVYYIFDGRTHRRIAEITAARVQVTSQHANGYPVITALVYLGNDHADFLTLKYVERSYSTITKQSVTGAALAALIEQLRAVRLFHP